MRNRNNKRNNTIKKKNDILQSIPQSAWKDAFSVPSPQRKTEFLVYLQKENEYRERIQGHSVQSANAVKTSIGTVSFMISQITYIRKTVYLASLLILALSIMAAGQMGADSVWAVAAMMPFIALCMAAESARSVIYGMAEFEIASRFSIKSIMLARFGTIGFMHMVLLCILIPVISHRAFLSHIQIGIYLLVPYLAATVLELAAVRRFRGKEAISVCAAISVIISLLNTILKQLLTYLYGPKQFVIWILLAVYLTERAVREYRKMIYRTEEWIV